MLQWPEGHPRLRGALVVASPSPPSVALVLSQRGLLPPGLRALEPGRCSLGGQGLRGVVPALCFPLEWAWLLPSCLDLS